MPRQFIIQTDNIVFRCSYNYSDVHGAKMLIFCCGKKMADSFFYITVTNPIFGFKIRKMKKLIVIFSIATGAIFMANCTPKASKAIASSNTTSTTAATASAMTRDEANSKFSADQLEAGKVLFAGNCAKCHAIKGPETRTAAQWDKILQRMVPKAKLNEEDGKLVKAYVIAHSKQG
jgi:cytochrome c5